MTVGQEAKKEAAAAIAVRDQALKALEGVVEEYQGQLDARSLFNPSLVKHVQVTCTCSGGTESSYDYIHEVSGGSSFSSLLAGL